MDGGKTGEGYVDPLRSHPFGGYGFLAPLDDGSWNHLVQPGASGFGMMVYSMHAECSNCGDFIEQWLLPALVQWRSIIDETHHVQQDVLEYFYPEDRPGEHLYNRTLYGPMVGITQYWVPDSDGNYSVPPTTVQNMLWAEEDMEVDSDEGVILGTGFIKALAPLMTMTPIDAALFAEWLPLLKKQWLTRSTLFDNFHMCNCSLEGYDDPECMVVQWDNEWGTAGWNTELGRLERDRAEANCRCSLHAFIEDWQNQFTQPMPDFADQMPELFTQTWEYARDRYLTAWKYIEDHKAPTFTTSTGRNAWLTSFSRRFSPYSAAYGLREYLTEHGLEQYAA